MSLVCGEVMWWTVMEVLSLISLAAFQAAVKGRSLALHSVLYLIGELFARPPSGVRLLRMTLHHCAGPWRVIRVHRDSRVIFQYFFLTISEFSIFWQFQEGPGRF